MATSIRFLGAAGFLIDGGGKRVIIDPFLDASPCPPIAANDIEGVDVILVTHAAPDHIGDTASIARRLQCPIVCGADTRLLLLDQGVPAELVRATVWGIVVQVGGVVIRPVESHHWSSATLSDGSVVTGSPLGFIVQLEPDVSIYHWGDSAIFGDMRLIQELYHPTVGLLGPTHPKELAVPVLSGPGEILTGEMSPDEAALAASMLGVRLAVATHYFNADDAEVEEFLHLATTTYAGRYQALAPKVGQSIHIEAHPWSVSCH